MAFEISHRFRQRSGRLSRLAGAIVARGVPVGMQPRELGPALVRPGPVLPRPRLSRTFAGIAPSSVPPFVVAQLAGAGLAVLAVRALYPTVSTFAADVVVPHKADPAINHLDAGARETAR